MPADNVVNSVSSSSQVSSVPVVSTSVGQLSVTISPIELPTVCVESQADDVVVGLQVPNVDSTVSPIGAECTHSEPQVCVSWGGDPGKNLGRDICC